MWTLFKNLIISSKYENEKVDLQEKFEAEQRYLDYQIENEDKALENVHQSSMHNIIGLDAASLSEKDAAFVSNCVKRVGILSKLEGNYGIIDSNIFFDVSVASAVINDIKVGNRIEYLSYEPNADNIKVIKISQIVDEEWDSEAVTQEKIDLKIAELKADQPTYFNTNQRSILGMIKERKPSSIVIDTDYKCIEVDLDGIEIDFVAKEGDRVYMCCNMQIDEDYVDKQGEILEVVSVQASRIMKEEVCKVSRLYEDWGVLNDDCYFTFDIMPTSLKLEVGEVVHGDLIECERGQFIWRCIKLCQNNESNINKSTHNKKSSSTPNELQDNPNHTVTVTPDKRCIFANTFETQKLTMTITNNTNRTVKINRVDVLGNRRESQVNLIDPTPGCSFELKPHDKRDLLFEIESRFYGINRDVFIIQLDKFRVKRSITTIVCDNEADAEIARADVITNKSCIPKDEPIHRNNAQLSRHYANQVWTKKRNVIPGVSMIMNRRFVAHRIGYFEVPDRLRNAYLSSDDKNNKLENIEGMFPCLREELSFKNYVTRFQTLLFLEEIDQFVNFRKYDRERAHFVRESEYLSLIIENLAERRPSLVIGDTVRAINPWTDEDNDEQGYDGIIHKVLFNRILLKFNAVFQSKYNGEDYRLEFYFSRFSFRKQHYATAKIVQNLGEKFLFPTKVERRDRLQVNVHVNTDGMLEKIDSSEKCQWYNPTLNDVQKQAVCNVLRGESKNMPYVIFGPPGTGKTITLVECALQLVKLVPGVRLLIGTPSNSSADLITTRIVDSNVLKAGDFIRLVSLNQIEKELVPEHLKPYSATVDIGIDGTCENKMIVTDSGLKLKCQMKYLGGHRITISTCTTLGNFLQMPFPPGHFTHVLIDESGQCTETELMIAVSQVSQSRGQVVLAGDPMQLNPIVTNNYAGNLGLSVSFLERILERIPYVKDKLRFPTTLGYNPCLLTKLIYNYRSLRSILDVYNNLFYDSELLPMISDQNSREATLLRELDTLLPKSDMRAKTHGAFFYGMRSENLQGTDSPSWYNPLEAKNLFLMTIQLYRQNIKPESIGIITPYAKQVKHLRSLFITADIAMPKIASVEEFQGQERDIILMSTVRSTENLISNDLRYSLGFVKCSKRMNVAISRARYLLFVFGNPHLLALDPSWRYYIQHCINNEAYLGCDLPDNMNLYEDEKK